MSLILFFFAYQIIQFLAFPFVIGYLLFRKIYKKKQSTFFHERFGFVPRSPNNKNIVWLHAASVGETLSLEYLIPKIKHEFKNCFCYLTVGTESAKNMVKKSTLADYVSFFPYDFLPCMFLAYHRIKPSVLIIVEAELWPNLLMMAQFKKIKIYGLNSRINSKSKTPTFLQPFFRTLLNCFNHFFTQSENDTARFADIGMHAKKLTTLGNLKAYNVVKKREALEKTLSPKFWSYTVLLAGSIHPGEIDHYITLFSTLKPEFSGLKLMLAPRHFHWKQELKKKLTAQNISFFLWDEEHSLPHETSLSQQLNTIFKQYDVFIICVLGELFKLYAYADIFFLGGTFVPVGGHNLLEPAVWKVPTIVGPQHWNCREHAQALEKRGALLVATSTQDLITHTKKLLSNHEQRELIQQNIATWLQSESNHIEKVLGEFLELIKKETALHNNTGP